MTADESLQSLINFLVCSSFSMTLCNVRVPVNDGAVAAVHGALWVDG